MSGSTNKTVSLIRLIAIFCESTKRIKGHLQHLHEFSYSEIVAHIIIDIIYIIILMNSK